MPERISAPNPSTRQLSGQLPGQGYFLSVLARRTYQIDVRAGRCVLAPEQLPLQEKVLLDPDSGETLADADLVHWKPLTDVVVRGHVHLRFPKAETAAGVRVGVHRKQLVAVGPRRAAYDAAGHVVFSPPEPFSSSPCRSCTRTGDATPSPRSSGVFPARGTPRSCRWGPRPRT